MARARLISFVDLIIRHEMDDAELSKRVRRTVGLVGNGEHRRADLLERVLSGVLAWQSDDT